MGANEVLERGRDSGVIRRVRLDKGRMVWYDTPTLYKGDE